MKMSILYQLSTFQSEASTIVGWADSHIRFTNIGKVSKINR